MKEEAMFREDVSRFREKISKMSRLMFQDKSSDSVPSHCVGGVLQGLHSELFDILEKDYSEEE